jgi:hypothetical protein
MMVIVAALNVENFTSEKTNVQETTNDVVVFSLSLATRHYVTRRYGLNVNSIGQHQWGIKKNDYAIIGPRVNV